MKTVADKNKFKSNIMLVTIVLLIFLMIVGTVFFCNFYAEKKSSALELGSARYDLSEIDFDSDGSAYLSGEWEFYYGKFLITDGEKTNGAPERINVPSSWSGIVATGRHDAGGYATYRCYVSSVNSESYLTVYIPNIACAYKIYINGTPVTVSGTLSKTYNKTFTSASHYSLPYKFDSGKEYEITVEISSDHYSGIYMPVLMTKYTYDNSALSSLIAFRFVLCGIVFLCGLIFIIFRRFVSKKLYSVWLPVLSFFLLLRMLITTEAYTVIQPLLFNIGYEEINIFIFVSTFIIKLVALIYIVKSLNIKAADSTFVTFGAIFLTLAIGINFLPNSIFDTYYFVSLQILSSIIDLYIINKLCIEIVNKTQYAVLYLISYLFLVYGIFMDVIYTNGMIGINCSSVMPACFFAFTVITLIIHALRIKQMYNTALRVRSLEADLERANTAVMISQIQPHFLYNALNTIKSLIKRDPKTAEKAVIDFSLYLRGNMDSLTQKDMILFSEELDHIKYYCNIEKLRFQDKLEVVYKIETDNFFVPTLSVQPIVENAIKHGVTKTAEGGTVIISSYEDDSNYYIKVEDNGKGFDVEKIAADSGRSHIGISNMKKRFETLAGADISIESEIDKGTVVTVKLPKNRNVRTLQESLRLSEDNGLFGEMNI